MFVGVDVAIVGVLCVGVPMCAYAMMKEYNMEKETKRQERLKRELELTKLQIETEKLKEAAPPSKENINVKGMF